MNNQQQMMAHGNQNGHLNRQMDHAMEQQYGNGKRSSELSQGQTGKAQ